MILRSFQMALFLTALLVSAVAIPPSLRAQQSTVGDPGVTAPEAATPVTSAPASAIDPTPAPGPRAGSTGFAWPVETSFLDYGERTVQGGGSGVGPNVALMAVGGAAVVVGLLIGGDGGTGVAIAGGVIGLVGLYRYLK